MSISTGTISDPPIASPLVDPPTKRGDQEFYMTAGWYQWLLALIARIQRAAQLLLTTTLTNQSASIGATPIALGAISAGLYRVSWYTRVTQAATVNSALTITIGWTESAIPQTQSGAVLNGNTVVTGESGSRLVLCDAVSTITYATTYVTAGATPMKYRLTVVVEAVD